MTGFTPELVVRTVIHSLIAAHGTTDAAVVHLKDFLIRANNEFVVNADFAEFIFDDGDALAVLLGQDAVQQRSFSRTEKTGQDRYGDWIVLFHKSCKVWTRRRDPRRSRWRRRKKAARKHPNTTSTMTGPGVSP
jgi:sulfur carrier protein ThiS